MADSRVPAALVVFQKVACVPTSSKSVPPTATLNGVDAIPLTAKPPVADVAVVKSSQPAEPPSPAETVTVIPCAAACSQRLLKKAFPADVNPASQAPKLRLITSAELLSITYSDDRSIPDDVSVSSDTTKSTFAPGATAPDHSTSKSASPSSFPIPGSGPFNTTVGGLAVSPNKL